MNNIEQLKQLVERADVIELFAHAYDLSYEEQTELNSIYEKIKKLIRKL